MLELQVLYRAAAKNSRGRYLETIQVPVEHWAILPTDNMLAVTLRAKDSDGVWQPLRRVTEKDHVALILFFRDESTHWDLLGWDDADIDPIDNSLPFADRSSGLRHPYPLRGAVMWFDGVAVSMDEWAEVLAEIDERQREVD